MKTLIKNYDERSFGRKNYNIDFDSKTSSPSSDARIDKRRVAIILGYFNGPDYIEEQLFSINNQTYPATKIFVFDDGSDHNFSFEMIDLEKFSNLNIDVTHGTKNIGFVDNFLKALEAIPDNFEYFAFSDQDDIWNEDKLEVAIGALEKTDPEIPALYCARTEIVDETGEFSSGKSPLFKNKPSFANAIIQNIGGGNTMLFNKAAHNLIITASKNQIVVSHDWWCYQLVTGAGGEVIYDPEPCLKYRQHAQNLVGENRSWGARLFRIRQLLCGEFRKRNDANILALSANKDLLTTANQELLHQFIQARGASLFKRLALFKKSGIHRQTLLGNLGLILGVFLNKV